ncbi:malonate--CoA ligase ACSF3, mitochondrial-like [Gigantopelta aegis]|uniref:malonate--CoA ligase ACSF3, mitochondrial-like n=1 Tax=Gigantopelta aegis TaxID=1735272 RepID=UPI001B889437|nr:malonate--CoA ligase ACSF3, mitochondrial-like [Gigantopelta aegis]
MIFIILLILFLYLYFQMSQMKQVSLKFLKINATLSIKSILLKKLLPAPNWQSSNSSRQLHICTKCLSRFCYNSKKSNFAIPVFLKAEDHIGRTAIIDQNGRFSYDDILHYSTGLSHQLLKLAQCSNLNNGRVAFLCENDVSYVVAQWATWIAGGVAVPLSKSHPTSDLEYFVADSQSSLLVASEEFSQVLMPIATKLQVPLKILTKHDFAGVYDTESNLWFKSDDTVTTKRRKRSRPKGKFDDLVNTNKYKHMPAMIVYTSGTTGSPKGVVLTHGNLYSQMCAMVEAWQWSRNDVVLHVLPLHHLHGIVNVLMTSLFSGATCLMMPKFDAQQVWAKLLNPQAGFEGERINMFMAVPTIYVKLIEHFETRIRTGRVSRLASQYVKSMCQTRVRLMVSGSSALPQPVMEKWEQITGHRLLERYGMTETGMLLTNPIDGPRVPGSVGHPMPSVEVCIGRPNVYTEIGYDIVAQGNSKRTSLKSGEKEYFGELLVRGPNVFHEYWNKPEATRQAFTKNGWFKTGDTVAYVNGRYKIIGRTSVDVIKSGGHKISALDVERHLLSHPHVADCAVVGLPDLTWGQRVAAILVLKPEHKLSLGQLKVWAADKIPSYEIPTVVKCVEFLPRNAMGKINKKELLMQIFPEYTKQR